MSGAPARPSRSAFGGTLINSGAVRDPTRQLDAAAWNLMVWQVTGLGLIAPRAMLSFTAAASPVLLSRAEAWNTDRLTTGAFADPAFTVNGTGDFTIAWPTPQVDKDGVSAALAFSFAQAFVINTNPAVVKHAQAAPVGANPNQIRVCVFNAANALENGNIVAVLGY